MQSKIIEAVRDVTTVSAPVTVLGTAGGGWAGALSDNAIIIGILLTVAQIALNVGINWYYKHQTLKVLESNNGK